MTMQEPTGEAIIAELRHRAAAVGVKVYQAGDGSDGDALAALYPGRWWAVVQQPAGAHHEYGPFGSEMAALLDGLAKAKPVSAAVGVAIERQ